MAKKKAKSDISTEKPRLFYIFYNQERWDNWLNSLKDASFEFTEGSEEVPESLRILDSFSEDITLEALKIVKLFQNSRFTLDEAMEKVKEVEKIVMCEAPEGDLEEIVEMLQLSKVVLFESIRRYLKGEYDRDMKSLVKKGREMVDKDMEGALSFAAEIGANVINGTPCCRKYLKDDLESPTLFDEWLIECERMSEAMSSLKNFDEEAGEEV
ncbi:MAG: DUF2150 family protein [Methanomicrobiales archaeon]|nr:DUF2150 family protein [Methanomicrobiales archaeon]